MCQYSPRHTSTNQHRSTGIRIILHPEKSIRRDGHGANMLTGKWPALVVRPHLVLAVVRIEADQRTACAGELRPGSYPGNAILINRQACKPGCAARKVFNGPAE